MYAIQAIPTFFATHSLSIFVGGAITMGLGFLRRSLALKILAAVGMILAGLAALWKRRQEKAEAPFSAADEPKLLQHAEQALEATLQAAKPKNQDDIFIAIQLTDGSNPRTWMLKTHTTENPSSRKDFLAFALRGMIGGSNYKSRKCSLEMWVVNLIPAASRYSIDSFTLTVFKSSISSASLENSTPASLPEIARFPGTRLALRNCMETREEKATTIFKDVATIFDHQGSGSWYFNRKTGKAAPCPIPRNGISPSEEAN